MNKVLLKTQSFFKNVPPVTFSIIIICVIVWFLQIATSKYATQLFSYNPIFAVKEPYRYITAAFLHDTSNIGFIPNPLHLIMNMYSLWVIGPILERTFGTLKFIVLYLFSAIGGHIFLGIWAVILSLFGDNTISSHISFGGWLSSTIGASGAIFGLIISLVCLMKKVKANVSALIAIIILNLVFPFFITGIAWQAHLGGALIGFLVTCGYVYLPERIHIANQKYEFEKMKKDFEEKREKPFDTSSEDIREVVTEFKKNTDTFGDAIGMNLPDEINKHGEEKNHFHSDKKKQNKVVSAIDSVVEKKIVRKHKKALITTENAWVFSSVFIFILLLLGIVLIDCNVPFVL